MSLDNSSKKAVVFFNNLLADTITRIRVGVYCDLPLLYFQQVNSRHENIKHVPFPYSFGM